MGGLTFQQFSSPLLFCFDHHSQEVIPRPEILVFHFLRHQLFHCPSQLLVLFQILRYSIRLFFHVEIVLPLGILRTRRVRSEAFEGGMYSVQLCVEPCAVDDPFAVLIFAFEEHLSRPVFISLFRGRSNGHGIAEEVANVGTKFENCRVRRFFSLLEFFQPFCSFSTETRNDAFGFS